MAKVNFMETLEGRWHGKKSGSFLKLMQMKVFHVDISPSGV